MKGPAVLVLSVGLVFVLVAPGFSWDGVDHQLIYSLAVSLASNDGGEDFAKAKAILEKYIETMKKGVIGPDVDYKLAKPSVYSSQIICQPIYPPLYHAHDAMMHVGFDGLTVDDSERRAIAYGQRAIQKWLKGDCEGSLYDLGCIMHLLQDASFCGHSNLGFFSHIGKHSAFENWVLKQTTTDGKTPKPLETLFEEGWMINTGGIYLKQPWQDDQGREHWAGGLESWIDVAAHLSYNHLTYTLPLDYSGCEFGGQARQQFVSAQRVSAGLLVDFFRQVGVIPEPMIYYLRRGEVSRVRLGDNQPERLGSREKFNPDVIWPTTSPDGKSKLSWRDSQIKERGQSDFSVTVGKISCGWDAADGGWGFLPKRISRAFYLNNYFIAVADASEVNNWRHLWLVLAVPIPDNWWTCKGANQYEFDVVWDDLQPRVSQKVNLP